MSNFKKFVAGLSTIAMAVSMLVVPVAKVDAATAGEVYKTTDGTVWFITKDMQKRPFTSAGAFMSYGFLSFSQVKDADSSVTALPSGSFIAPQDGRIFCATASKGSDVAGECSLVTGGKKAAFTSSSVFTGQGYSFARAYYGDSSFLEKTSNIDNASAQHRAGTLINNNGTVQLVVSGGLWGTPSMDVFNSWGWSFADVVPANSADVLLSQTGVISARMAGELSPSATSTPSNPGDCNLQGAAGTASIAVTTTDVETQVSTDDDDVKIAGIRVEAVDSDIALKSMKVTMTNAGSGSTRLDRYASEVTVWAGDVKVGSADVDDFTKSGTDYSKVITLDCSKVVKGGSNKVNYYVAVTPISHIDGSDASNSWTVNMGQIRYEDGQGVVSTDTATTYTSAGSEFVNLATSGDVKATLSQDTDSNPVAGNVEVSDTTTTSGVNLLAFKIKAEGSDLTFDTLKVVLDSTGVTTDNLITPTIELKKGSVSLGTKDLAVSADQTVTFTLDDDYTVDKGDTDVFTISAKINKIATTTGAAGFDEGDSLKVSLAGSTNSAVFASSLVDVNGDAVSNVSGTAVGNVQAFYSEGISVSNFNSAVVGLDNGSGAYVQQTYTIDYDVTAFGKTFYIPKTAVRTATTAGTNLQGLVYSLETSADAVTATGTASASSITSNANTVGGYFEVPDGETRTFHVTVTVTKADDALITGHGTATVPAFYRIQLEAVRYDTDQSGTPSSLLLIPAQDFQAQDGQIGA